jgi:hypothetical protein
MKKNVPKKLFWNKTKLFQKTLHQKIFKYSLVSNIIS